MTQKNKPAEWPKLLTANFILMCWRAFHFACFLKKRVNVCPDQRSRTSRCSVDPVGTKEWVAKLGSMPHRAVKLRKLDAVVAMLQDPVMCSKTNKGKIRFVCS